LGEEFFFEDLFLLLGQDVEGVPLALESFDGVFGVLVVVDTGSIELVSEDDEGVEVIFTLVDFVVDVFDGVKLGLDFTGERFNVAGLGLGPGVELVSTSSEVNTESFVGSLDLGLVLKSRGTVVDLSINMSPSLLKRGPRDFGVGGFSDTVFGDFVDEAGQRVKLGALGVFLGEEVVVSGLVFVDAFDGFDDNGSVKVSSAFSSQTRNSKPRLANSSKRFSTR